MQAQSDGPVAPVRQQGPRAPLRSSPATLGKQAKVSVESVVVPVELHSASQRLEAPIGLFRQKVVDVEGLIESNRFDDTPVISDRFPKGKVWEVRRATVTSSA